MYRKCENNPKYAIICKIQLLTLLCPNNKRIYFLLGYLIDCVKLICKCSSTLLIIIS